MRNIVRKVVGRWTGRSLLIALTEWKQSVRQKKTLSNVLQRMVHRFAAMALDTWCEHAGERARMREVSTRMILRMNNVACARAFQLWWERCLEAERLRKGMERVLKHWCNTHKAAAMARWRGLVAEVVCMRNIVRKVVGRWLFRKLSVFFMAWLRFVCTLKSAAMSVHRMMRSRLQLAFDSFLLALDSIWQVKACSQKDTVVGLNLSMVASDFLVETTTTCASHLDIAGELLTEMSKALGISTESVELIFHGGTKQEPRFVFAVKPDLAQSDGDTHQALCNRLMSQIYQADSKLRLQPVGRRIVDGCNYGALPRDLQSLMKAQDSIYQSNYKLLRQTHNRVGYLANSLCLIRAFARFSRAALNQRMANCRLKKIRLVLGRWAGGVLLESFATWASSVRDTARLKRSASLVIRRWQCMQAAAALGAWKQATDYCAKARTVVLRKFLESSTLIVSDYLQRWVMQVQLLASIRALRAAVHTAPAATALKIWKQYHKLKAMVHFLNSVILRGNDELKAKTLKSWRFRSICQQKVALAREVHGYRQSDFNVGAWKARQLRKALVRWRETSLFEIFASWKQRVCLKNSLHLVVNRWRHTNTCRALQAWQGNVVDVRRARLLATKIVRRWTHLEYSRVVCMWRCYVVDKRMVSQRAGRILRRWMQMGLSSACMTWRQHSSATRSLRLASARIVSKWMRILMAKGFMRWLGVVASMNRTREVLTGTIRRWLHIALSQSWDAWLSLILQKAHANGVVFNVVRRMQLRFCSKAMNLWRDAVLETKSVICQMVKVIQRWKRQSLVCSWSSWQEHLIMRKLARRALVVLSHAAVWKAFACWRDRVSWQISCKVKSKNTLQRWQYLGVCRAFACWQTVARDAAILKHKLGMAVRRWRQRFVGPAFRAWSNQHKVICFAVSTAAKLRYRSTWSSLLCWKHTTIQRKQHARKLARAVNRCVRVNAAKYFSRWRDQADVVAHHRIVMCKIVVRWSHKASSGALTAWRLKVQESLHRRQVIARVVHRFTFRQMTRGWMTWVHRVQKHFKMSQKMTRLQARWSQSLTFDCTAWALSAWQKLTKAKAAANRILVERWARWFSLWFDMARHGLVWREVQLRALEIGHINRLRICFKGFLRAVERLRVQGHYASKARLLVDHMQDEAESQVAVIQQRHMMSVHQIEDDFYRQTLHLKAARLLQAQTAINRMLKIRKAVALDTFGLVTELLRVQLGQAARHSRRMTQQREYILRGRYLQRWITEVQAARIDSLEAACRASTSRITQLETDKLVLQNLVEEALKEQEQLAIDYHMFQTAPKAKKAKVRPKNRSTSPPRVRQTGRNPEAHWGDIPTVTRTGLWAHH